MERRTDWKFCMSDVFGLCKDGWDVREGKGCVRAVCVLARREVPAWVEGKRRKGAMSLNSGKKSTGQYVSE